MWIEAIVTRDDLADLLGQLFPLKIHFDASKKERWLFLDSPTEIDLVPGKGLRVTCPGELMWTLSVVHVPIKLITIRVLLSPEIVNKQQGDVLSFRIQLEESDFAGIPSLIDHTIMKAVNEALTRHDLVWDFTKTLTRTVEMPGMLEPIESLSIAIEWGKRRIDAEALVLVVSFKLGFNRRD